MELGHDVVALEVLILETLEFFRRVLRSMIGNDQTGILQTQIIFSALVTKLLTKEIKVLTHRLTGPEVRSGSEFAYPKPILKLLHIRQWCHSKLFHVAL